jgi:hypothetical protein
MIQKSPSDLADEYAGYFRECSDLGHLNGVASALSLLIKKLPEHYQEYLRKSYMEVKEELKAEK